MLIPCIQICNSNNIHVLLHSRHAYIGGGGGELNKYSYNYVIVGRSTIVRPQSGDLQFEMPCEYIY